MLAIDMFGLPPPDPPVEVGTPPSLPLPPSVGAAVPPGVDVGGTGEGVVEEVSINESPGAATDESGDTALEVDILLVVDVIRLSPGLGTADVVMIAGGVMAASDTEVEVGAAEAWRA